MVPQEKESLYLISCKADGSIRFLQTCLYAEVEEYL